MSPIVNREIQVSVKAHDWPSSPQSILCEAYALEKEDPSFLDRLTSIVLEKKAAETKWLHDDAAARNLAIQASLHPKLLEWSLVLRAASPYCELMRSLAPSDVLVRDHHLDDIVACLLYTSPSPRDS